MSPRAVLIIVTAGLCAAAPGAAADCQRPLSAVVPAGGASLPPNPVLYLFTPGSGRASDLRVSDADDRPVSFTMRRLPGPDAFQVHLVRVKAKAGTRLIVRPSRLDYDRVSRYLVADTWRRPSKARVTIDRVQTHSLPETCRGYVTRDLVVRRLAPAYRVEWAASAEDYRAGERRSLVLPFSLLELGPATKRQTRFALLELGDPHCLGQTFVWGRQPVFVGVAALHADGSEDPPPEQPTRVTPPPKHRRRTPCVAP